MTRRAVAVLLAAVLLALAGCTGPDGGGDAGPTETAPTETAPTETAPAEVETTEAPSPAPVPPERACYLLTFDQALAPVTRAKPRSCDQPHTLRTISSGRVGDLVKGKVGPIDSPRVQRAVAAECPRRLAEFLGGPEQALRLSMFRPVWFTPTLAQADRGQDWYRCDVIALAAEGTLASLTGRLERLLGRLGWKDQYGLCGTAEPGTSGFEHVSCARRHAWRALSTVPITAERYPGPVAVQALGEEPCTATARAVAQDPLDFRWGYEWPTLEQWRAGKRYGVCWAPAPG
jgi:hypothetical protein